MKISVNLHGIKLTECDYVVCLDKHVMVEATATVGPHKTVGRSCHGRGYDYLAMDPGGASCSGTFVLCAAWRLGCAPIIVMGMDGYRDGTYWWARDGVGHDREDSKQHVERWKRELTMLIPNAQEVVRAFDEPLSAVFPLYAGVPVPH